MKDYHHIWLQWAKMLHRWGFDRLGYLLLAEFGSLAILLAQGIYLVEPMLQPHKARETLRALGELLEDEGNRDWFAHLLEEQGRTML